MAEKSLAMCEFLWIKLLSREQKKNIFLCLQLNEIYSLLKETLTLVTTFFEMHALLVSLLFDTARLPCFGTETQFFNFWCLIHSDCYLVFHLMKADHFVSCRFRETAKPSARQIEDYGIKKISEIISTYDVEAKHFPAWYIQPDFERIKKSPFFKGCLQPSHLFMLITIFP